MKYSPLYLIIVVPLIALLAWGCDATSPYPVANVSIAKQNTLVNPSESSVTVYLKITNSDTRTVHYSTISLKVQSDQKTYYRTIESSTLIVPGASIFLPARIVFDDPAEVLQSPMTSIEAAFFQ